jgi:hypothetical protein
VQRLIRAADNGQSEWEIASYRIQEFDKSVQDLKVLVPEKSKVWDSLFESMKAGRLVAAAPLEDDVVSSPQIVSRTKLFPSNLDDWKTAVPDFKETNDRLSLDILGFQVMQSWEAPLMVAMAKAACRENDVTLEIGFGLGICAGELQKIKPRLHVIVECNAGVADRARALYQREIASGQLMIVDGFWQDLCISGGPLASDNLKQSFGVCAFDSIVFDAYPMSAEEVGRNELLFFRDASRLLAKGGRFTYFSNEKSTIGRSHQRALRDAFHNATVCIAPIRVSPWKDCEYWTAKEILNVVITKQNL